MRRLLGPIAVVCLLLQAAVVVSAQTALWMGAADNWRECQCIHGEHAICPMHHARTPGSERCVWRTAGDHSGAVLASLVGVFGFLQPSVPAAIPAHSRVTTRAAAESLVALFTSPDSPPPRL